MLQPTKAFLRHTLSEGERVHYRPQEEVVAALDEGYLELELTENALTRHYLIRKIGQEYRLSGATAGDRPIQMGQESSLGDLLEKHDIDLHAYRWYPHHTVSTAGRWLVEATSLDPYELQERINTMLSEMEPEYELPEMAEMAN